jgi:hypothetical protein
MQGLHGELGAAKQGSFNYLLNKTIYHPDQVKKLNAVPNSFRRFASCQAECC